ncbi:TIGR02757 family protein [Parelusimicrobium proximum]|uniref:TIGR02757 family protein n=1 Tax=Parelusimicrobium proximum TaxID=3228953 RepID=UPI003D180EAA
MIEKSKINALYKKYNKRRYVSPDPLQFLYNYTDKRDRETAGLIAGCFAYGNVKQIIRTLTLIFGKMGKSPYKFIKNTDDFYKYFKGFKYRFTTDEELVNFLTSIQKILKKHGSLEACFMSYFDNSHDTVETALKGFAAELRADVNVKSLVPDPAKKSALKRLNLYLRWMIRQDDVDPGGWDKVPASKLIVPLDTHMHRLGQKLGLTARRQADMATAVEISRNFGKYCKDDPIKYDFCITRFGIRDDMDQTELDK